jgi:hypothetical protein
VIANHDEEFDAQDSSQEFELQISKAAKKAAESSLS